MLRGDYLEICDGHKGAAALLSFFEYWHNIRLEQSGKAREQNAVAEKHGQEGTQDTSLYQFHTAEQLYAGVLGMVGRPSINSGLTLLKKKGFIEIHKNPNPRYSFDSTKHFIFCASVVQNALSGLAETDNSVDRNCQTGSQKLSDGLAETVRTSPEITTEITTENTDKKKQAKRKNLSTFDYSNLPISAVLAQEVVEYRQHVLKKPLTQRALNALAENLASASEVGMTPEKAVEVMELNNWRSFKPDWIRNQKNHNNGAYGHDGKSSSEPPWLVS